MSAYKDGKVDEHTNILTVEIVCAHKGLDDWKPMFERVFKYGDGHRDEHGYEHVYEHKYMLIIVIICIWV